MVADRKSVPIEVLRRMTPAQVRAAMLAFPASYAGDWDRWMGADRPTTPELFESILGRWHACRPSSVRLARSRPEYEGPFLVDLVRRARRPLRALGDLDVGAIGDRTPEQEAALQTLWRTFLGLCMTRDASCVGITKAVLLQTDGRIGPAFDSWTQRTIGHEPSTSSEWVQSLDEVAKDIAAFQDKHGPLRKVAPPHFAHLGLGRIYDMIVGPKE